MTLIMLLTAAAVVVVDWLTKLLAASCLTQSVTVIGHLLEFRLIHNSGMALGFLAGNRFAVLLLPIIVNVVAWYQLRRYEPTRYLRVVEGLVLGGFIGNFAERLLTGTVTDMIFLPFLPWFVCNVADIAICVGVGLLLISLLFRPQDWREKLAKNTEDSGQ